MSNFAVARIEKESEYPASLHAEQTILGAMMVDDVALSDAFELLVVDDFRWSSHRAIFRAILEVLQDGMHVDLVTVCEELRRKRSLDAIGGQSYLASLSDGLPRRLSIQSYVRIVKDYSLLAQLIQTCQLAVTKAQGKESEAITLVSDTEAQLHKLMTQMHQEESLPMQVASMVESIRRRRSGEETSFVTSGLDVIDHTHGGFAIGEMTIIAARPRVGKSTILRQGVIANCKRGEHVHLMTPEMSTEQVLQVLVGIESGVPFRRIRHAERLSAADIEEIEAASREISKWPFTLDDTSPITAPEVVARARSVKRKFNTKLFGLDYLQKMKYPGKLDNRHVAVSDAMIALTQLAKNEKVAVVAISSLTEPSGREKDRMPTIDDLRGSGDIKYEANTVMLLHRPLEEDTQKLTRECLLIIGKARSDQDGIKKIWFNPDSISFEGEQAYLSGLAK